MFDDDRDYQVVRNHEEQYSIWPVELDLPAGWEAAGPAGPKADCLAYITSVWTDLRPRSLREAMDLHAAADPGAAVGPRDTVDRNGVGG